MADKIKGITIEIGGQTTKLQAALKGATDKGRETATELNKINSALKFNPDNVVLVAQKIDVLKERISATEEKLNTLKDVQGKIEEQFAKGDIGADEYRAFQRELIETESKLENFKNQLKETQNKFEENTAIISKIKNAYNDLKEKIEQVKEEHPKLTSAFEKSGDAAKTLASGGLKAVTGAAAGTAAGVAAITTAAVTAAKELYEAAEQAAAAGDAIDEASQRMGVSAESFQELQYAAKMSGVEVSTLETAAKTLAKSGSDMDLSDAINQIASIKDESERTEKAIELFGSKAAYQMGPMLAQGAEGVQALKDQAHELGLVMSNEAVSASAVFNDSLDNMTGVIDAFKNNISAKFLPGITDIMDGVTAFFSNSEYSLENAEELINSGLWDIVNNFEEIMSQIIEKADEAVKLLVYIAPDFINFLAETIGENTEPLLSAAFEIVSTLVNSLLTEDNIELLVNAALGIVTGLVGFLGDNSELLVDSAFTMINSLIGGLLSDENSGKLITSALDIVTAIVTGLIGNAPQMVGGALELIGVLVDELIHYDWWQVAKDILDGIKGGLKSLITGESNDYDGSHAGGIGYVPYSGYTSELHEGERVLTAAQNRNYMRQQQEQAAMQETMNRRLDALERSMNNKAPNQINITATGSARSIVRSLNFYIEEENRRKGVIQK